MTEVDAWRAWLPHFGRSDARGWSRSTSYLIQDIAKAGLPIPAKIEAGVLVPVLLRDRTRTGGADNPSLDNYRVTLGIADFELDFFGLVRDLSRVALEEYFAQEA